MQIVVARRRRGQGGTVRRESAGRAPSCEPCPVRDPFLVALSGGELALAEGRVRSDRGDLDPPGDTPGDTEPSAHDVSSRNPMPCP